MGDARLYPHRTADTPVSGILAAEAGSICWAFHGVVLRSAFIPSGQNALAVDPDAELERRIAALITTGEEDTS